MSLLSCIEDLYARTLAGIPTVFAKLDYIAGLRSDGRYAHWGLARTYGEDQAHDALSRVHTELWLQLLRTQLPALCHEFCQYTAQADAGIERWFDLDTALVPLDRGGGSERHFAAVMHTLSALKAAAVCANAA